MAKRTEGWGNIHEARDAHFFRDNRSLCGRWLVFGVPHWETNQGLGSAPTKGTCKGCWKKRSKEESASVKGTTT